MPTRFLRRHLFAIALFAIAGCTAPAWPYLAMEPVEEPGYEVLARANPYVPEPRVTVSTLVGSPGRNGLVNKPGAEARFSHPRGIAFDRGSGNLLVADTANHVIRTVTPAGVVSTYAGTGERGMYYGLNSATTRSRATFSLPYCVGVGPTGTHYVADTGRHQLQRIAGNTVSTQTGLWGVVARRSTPLYQHPSAVAIDSRGTVYFLQGHALFRIAGGALSTVAGAYSSYGLLFESFVSQYETARPRPGLVDGPGATARFALPQGLAVDAQDNLFIADTFNHAIRKVTFTAGVATVSTIAGERGTITAWGQPVVTGFKGYEDGAGTSARFTFPYGIAVDGSGNLIVADRGNHALRKVAAGTNRVTTLVGRSGLASSADGPGGTAGFMQPTGVAVDAAGAIYVTDSGNHTIRKVVQGP